MRMTRRNFIRTALAMPLGATFARYQAMAAAAQGLTKITRIQALELKDGRTLIRVDTDAGLSGYGECNTAGPVARSVIAAYNGRRPSAPSRPDRQRSACHPGALHMM